MIWERKEFFCLIYVTNFYFGLALPILEFLYLSGGDKRRRFV